MKQFTTIVLILVICITCGNTVSHRNHDVQNKTVKRDTIITLNDTLSLYYGSYNNNMKLWYNLYIVKKKKRIKIGKGNEYKGTGSELFSSLSPNANYVVVDAIIKDYVHESDKDSTLHENYTCAIIDLKKAKIVKQMQQDCDGSWNKKNQWVSSGGKVVFK
ncbi:hypothetical protein C1637_05945 [Chryseobacterium lactis]|uniref:Uncharacterized protein n=2 Tax=Chryseobacterium lactis TaxID=1241981 RepID=A0A3G6RIH2_CHRLC|nr:hypothetical protein EG342_21915 [Chryseobacterium lactis]AZB04771.1 hypothetical protein EG341_12795 [Chryseobacterium lactis]PNW14501.1 hypothetical protein C1637_05945 [Chryseobacterium lactis]